MNPLDIQDEVRTLELIVGEGNMRRDHVLWVPSFKQPAVEKADISFHNQKVHDRTYCPEIPEGYMFHI